MCHFVSFVCLPLIFVSLVLAEVWVTNILWKVFAHVYVNISAGEISLVDF